LLSSVVVLLGDSSMTHVMPMQLFKQCHTS
jgi:hypothetical protein